MAIQIPKQVIINAMHDLNRIEVFFSAIAMITDDSPDKVKFNLHMLACEGADLCSKLHEAIDLAGLEASADEKVE